MSQTAVSDSTPEAPAASPSLVAPSVGASSIASSVEALIELFRGQLAEVRFPDVDADTLEEAASGVTAAADSVERARAALERAAEALRGEQRALREHARLAYRYAKVFATGNDELSAALDSISLDDPPAAKPKKRRGRKPKKVAGAAAVPQLALEEEPTPTAVAS